MRKAVYNRRTGHLESAIKEYSELTPDELRAAWLPKGHHADEYKEWTVTYNKHGIISGVKPYHLSYSDMGKQTEYHGGDNYSGHGQYHHYRD